MAITLPRSALIFWGRTSPTERAGGNATPGRTVPLDEFEPVSEWTVTLPLFRTDATLLCESSGAVEFEIWSR